MKFTARRGVAALVIVESFIHLDNKLERLWKDMERINKSNLGGAHIF